MRAPLNRAMAVAAVLLIAFLTLTPHADVTQPSRPLCFTCGDQGMADAVLNVLLFLPLGLTLLLGGLRARQAVVVGAGLSLFIEVLQQFIPGRDPSVRDLAMNTAGAYVGTLLPRFAISLELMAHRHRSRLSVAAATAASVVVVGLAMLLQPSIADDTYFAQWIPPRPGWESFDGRVVSASIGTLPLPDGRLDASSHVQALLASGAPLEVVALVAHAKTSRTALFAIADAHERESLFLAVDGRDLLIRQRTHSAAWRLDEPGLRARRVIRLAPPETLRVRVWRVGAEWCVSASDQRCGIGFTAGSGWRALYAAGEMGFAAQSAVGCLWLVALLLPFGFTARRDGATYVGAVLLIATFALGPVLSLWMATTVAEWIAGAAGVCLGAYARIARDRVSPRSKQGLQRRHEV